MNYRNRILFTSLMAAAGIASLSADNLFFDFSKGIVPSSFVIEGTDPDLIPERCYREPLELNPWTIANFGTTGNAIACLSHTHEATPGENSMTLPSFKVPANAVLSWKGRSAHPDFKDSYRVEILSASGNPATVYSTDAEQSKWTSHALSLSDYEGKEINVRFVCDSKDGYMLLIDDIFLGTPEDNLYLIEDTTRKFVGNVGSTKVTGTFTNIGKTLNNAELMLVQNDFAVDVIELGASMKAGESIEYSFDLPVELNSESKYEIAISGVSEDPEILASGTVYCSWYPKNLVVDKATGMWCTNCPEGSLHIEALEEMFGDQLFVVETHVQNGNDPLVNTEVWPRFKWYSAPYMMVNRNGDTASANTAKFDNEYYTFTPAMVELSFDGAAQGNEAIVKTRTTFAKDYNNASDSYRIGYCLTADFADPEDPTYYQSNGCTRPKHDRFRFMSSRIEARLLKFHNVNLSDVDKSFDGIEKSLPAEIKSGESYDYDLHVELPKTNLGKSLSDMRLTAFVIDTATGRIINSAALPLDGSNSSVDTAIDEPISDGISFCNIGGRNVIRISDGSASCSVSMYDLSGRLLTSFSGNVSGEIELPATSYSGMAIVKVSTEKSTASAKIIL